MTQLRTNYRGATNYRGSRIYVSNGVVLVSVVPYDYGLSAEENHRQAALQAAKKLGIKLKDTESLKTGFMFYEEE